jgi:hypothetical protein
MRCSDRNPLSANHHISLFTFLISSCRRRSCLLHSDAWVSATNALTIKKVVANLLCITYQHQYRWVGEQGVTRRSPSHLALTSIHPLLFSCTCVSLYFRGGCIVCLAHARHRCVLPQHQRRAKLRQPPSPSLLRFLAPQPSFLIPTHLSSSAVHVRTLKLDRQTSVADQRERLGTSSCAAHGQRRTLGQEAVSRTHRAQREENKEQRQVK